MDIIMMQSVCSGQSDISEVLRKTQGQDFAKSGESRNGEKGTIGQEESKRPGRNEGSRLRLPRFRSESLLGCFFRFGLAKRTV